MGNIRLLSTDFDGTLINIESKKPCVDSLAIELEKIHQEKGCWVINTGRPFEELLEGLKVLSPPVMPHYLITDERYLYYLQDGVNWKSLGEWNDRCDLIHHELFKTAGLFFEEIENMILEYQGAATIYRNAQDIPECLLASSGEVLDDIELRLLEHVYRPDQFFFQRTDTHLRFCHEFYNKGSVLSELSRFLSIETKNILAIGDHHNDLAMLNEEVASMVACPSNAHDKVKKIVTQQRGHVSMYEAGKGTAEAISIFRQKKKGYF